MARRRKSDEPGCLSTGCGALILSVIVAVAASLLVGDGEVAATVFMVVFGGLLLVLVLGRFSETSADPSRHTGGRVRPAIPRDVQEKVYERDGGMCRHCGATEDLQFDHIVPFSKGGAATEQNLQLLCAPCNQSKGAGF